MDIICLSPPNSALSFQNTIAVSNGLSHFHKMVISYENVIERHYKDYRYFYQTRFKNNLNSIVGKGGHTPPPPFSKSNPPFLRLRPPLPFLEIQEVLTFHRSPRKTKVLNNSYNQFVYHFYPQSILVLEEFLQKW